MKLEKKFRKQLVWAIVIFVLSISLMSAIYILGNKPYVYINPGITMSAPSPVGTPYQPFGASKVLPGSGKRGVATSHTFSSQPASSTNVSFDGLYLSSKAQLHHVGGGYGGYAPMAVAHNTPSRGIVMNGSGAATMPITNFVSMAATRQVAPPAASDAPQMGKLAPRHAPGPPQPPGGDTGLPDDQQLVEHPIGEPWALALMAVLYALAQFMFCKRRKAA